MFCLVGGVAYGAQVIFFEDEPGEHRGDGHELVADPELPMDPELAGDFEAGDDALDGDGGAVGEAAAAPESESRWRRLLPGFISRSPALTTVAALITILVAVAAVALFAALTLGHTISHAVLFLIDRWQQQNQ